MQFAHLKGVVQRLLLYQQHLVTITTTSFRIFQSPPAKKLSYPLSVDPHCPLPSRPPTLNLRFCLYRFAWSEFPTRAIT